MALTSDNYLDLILAELNLTEARVRYALSLYWQLHADKGGIALQYLYAKRSVIDAMLGGTWEDIDVGTGAVTGKVSMDQRTVHLQKIRDNVDAEITQLNNNLRVTLPVAVAEPFISVAGNEFS